MFQASRILPFLYLGGYLDARDPAELRARGIGAVLNVSESMRFEADEDIRRSHVPISDYGDTSLEPVFERCSAIIGEAKSGGRNILVHCRHGQNRSPTVVVGYLIDREGMSLREAHELVTALRPIVSIHEEYFEQLRRLELRRSGRTSLSSEELGPSVQEFIRELRKRNRGE